MWNNRHVRVILSSRILLNMGVWIRNFAVLLYVSEMTDNDSYYVSLISVAEFAPIFIFSIIGGTFADRWKPRRTMVGSDLLTSASVFAVLLALVYGSWHALFFAAFVSSVLSQFSQPSAMKLFKRHVPEDRLQGVMALQQSISSLFMIIGPMAGAFVYAKFGIETSLAAMGVLILGSGLLLLRLPKDDEEPGQTRAQSRFWLELKAGLRYVVANRTLRSLGGTFMAAGLAAGLIQPLLLFVAIENLGRDRDFVQWLLATNGAATLVGGAFVMTAAKKVKPQRLLAFGLLVSAAGTVGIGWAHSLAAVLLLQIATGLCYPLIMIGIQTMIMRNTEGAYIGRVGGVMTPLFMGMMVVGMSLAGGLKMTLSLQIVYSISGILFLTGAAALFPMLGGGKSRAVEEGYSPNSR